MPTITEYLSAFEAAEPADEATTHDKVSFARWTGMQVAEQFVDNLHDDNDVPMDRDEVVGACGRAVKLFQRELQDVPQGEFFDGRRARCQASIEGATACREIAKTL